MVITSIVLHIFPHSLSPSHTLWPNSDPRSQGMNLHHSCCQSVAMWSSLQQSAPEPQPKYLVCVCLFVPHSPITSLPAVPRQCHYHAAPQPTQLSWADHWHNPILLSSPILHSTAALPLGDRHGHSTSSCQTFTVVKNHCASPSLPFWLNRPIHWIICVTDIMTNNVLTRLHSPGNACSVILLNSVATLTRG